MGHWCSSSLHLECVTRGGGRVIIQHGLKLSTQCTGSGASWEVQGQPPSVPCLWSLSMSYRAICRWLLLVLGLQVPKRRQSVNQGRLLLELGLGPLGNGTGHAKIRCCLSAIFQPLRDFRKVHSKSQDREFVWKTWKWLQ